MSRAAIPFRLLGAADLARLAEATSPVVGAWAVEWGWSLEDCTLIASDDFSSISDVSADGWLECSLRDEFVIAIGVPSDQRRELLERLLGAPLPPGGGASPLLNVLLHECMADLVARLKVHFGADRDAVVGWKKTISSGLAAYGSGAAYIRGRNNDCLPVIMLGGDAAARFVPKFTGIGKPATSLTRREESIDSLPTEIEVILGEADLTLADLTSIAAGDVIRLQTSFCDPVLVRSINGDALFTAYLGAAPMGNKAIQIVARAR